MAPLDWTLLVIAVAAGKPLDKAQLQKALFILCRRAPHRVGQSFYQFRNHKFGAFSHEIYRDVESLAARGLVQLWTGSGRRHVITDEGTRVARELPVDAETIDYVVSLVAEIQPLRFDELVRKVYAEFPETRERSVFEDSSPDSATPVGFDSNPLVAWFEGLPDEEKSDFHRLAIAGERYGGNADAERTALAEGTHPLIRG